MDVTMHTVALPMNVPPQMEEEKSMDAGRDVDESVVMAGGKEETNPEDVPDDLQPIVSLPQRSIRTGDDSKQRVMIEVKKSNLTINTCFDPTTPIQKTAASTKSHLRSKKQSMAVPGPCYRHSKGLGSVVNRQDSAPKHFVFSEKLFNPQLPSSPNRPLLFTEFLIRKLGQDKVDQACAVLRSAHDPIHLLDSEPEKIKSVIGEKNADCVQIFRYIISSNVLTPLHNQLSPTQLHLLQEQHHARTQSMHTPDATSAKAHRIPHLHNYPYSTRSTQTRPSAGAIQTGTRQNVMFLISPANSTATDASSLATTPVN
ncbi:MAG: hypothetical protein P4M11_02770 [Candidatus Pacebacteria bacterium]|nr:hypothetical protein [Candidatus Paceibacterota bacterium]